MFIYVVRGKGDVYNTCFKYYYLNLHKSLSEKFTNRDYDVACISSALDNQGQPLLSASGYFWELVT